MKHLVILILSAFTFGTSSAQRIEKVTFHGNGMLDVISFGLDGNVILNLREDGTISQFGVDLYKERGQENYANALENYMGRIEYYTEHDDAAYKGKVKVIGSTVITYYASYDDEFFRGKVKNIGRINLEYFTEHNDKMYSGKIKSIAGAPLTYYASYDNEMHRGKLKSLGSTQISYYSSFDDKNYRGKVKSIGHATFTYYSSYDRNYYGLKSGQPFQIVNGIKYYLRY